MGQNYDRLFGIIELMLISQCSYDDSDLVYIQLQRAIRLLSISIYTYLKGQNYDPSLIHTFDESCNKVYTNLVDILKKLYTYTTEIQSNTTNTIHHTLKLEGLKYIRYMYTYPLYFTICSTPETAIVKFLEEIDTSIYIPYAYLYEYVNILDVLVHAYPQLSYKYDIDVCIYDLYVYICSHPAVPTQVAYTGLDIRAPTSTAITTLLPQGNYSENLTNILEETLLYILTNVCEYLPNIYCMNMFLFHRAVALGLRSGVRKGGGPSDVVGEMSGSRQTGEDDDVGGMDDLTIPTATGQNSDPFASETSTDVMTYQQYTVNCREGGITKASKLASAATNGRVKLLATKCMSHIFSILHKQNTILPYYGHTDITLARTLTTTALQPINRYPNDQNSDSTIPCYASLYIQDIINTSCSLCTYTIHERSLLPLQIVSIQLMYKILLFFKNTTDPDYTGNLNGGQNYDNKMIIQYLSQILSAIRPCLLIHISYKLTLYSTYIVSFLLQQQYVSDKIAIKRLLKSLLYLLPTSEDSLSSKMSGGGAETRLSFRPSAGESDTSEELESINRLVHAVATANLYLLANPQTSKSELKGNKMVSTTTSKLGHNSALANKVVISNTIMSILTEHIHPLADIWRAYLLDTFRLLVHYTTPTSPTADVAEVKFHVKATHPNLLRGGLTYMPYSDMSILCDAYVPHIPVLLAACSTYLHIYSNSNDKDSGDSTNSNLLSYESLLAMIALVLPIYTTTTHQSSTSDNTGSTVPESTAPSYTNPTTTTTASQISTAFDMSKLYTFIQASYTVDPFIRYEYLYYILTAIHTLTLSDPPYNSNNNSVNSSYNSTYYNSMISILHTLSKLILSLSDTLHDSNTSIYTRESVWKLVSMITDIYTDITITIENRVSGTESELPVLRSELWVGINLIITIIFPMLYTLNSASPKNIQVLLLTGHLPSIRNVGSVDSAAENGNEKNDIYTNTGAAHNDVVIATSTSAAADGLDLFATAPTVASALADPTKHTVTDNHESVYNIPHVISIGHELNHYDLLNNILTKLTQSLYTLTILHPKYQPYTMRVLLFIYTVFSSLIPVDQSKESLVSYEELRVSLLEMIIKLTSLANTIAPIVITASAAATVDAITTGKATIEVEVEKATDGYGHVGGIEEDNHIYSSDNIVAEVLADVVDKICDVYEKKEGPGAAADSTDVVPSASDNEAVKFDADEDIAPQTADATNTTTVTLTLPPLISPSDLSALALTQLTHWATYFTHLHHTDPTSIHVKSLYTTSTTSNNKNSTVPTATIMTSIIQSLFNLCTTLWAQDSTNINKVRIHLLILSLET